jgi:hypothetical protein
MLPMWSRDGKELFFVRNGQIVGVEVNTQGGFEFGPEQTLPIPSVFLNTGLRNYDITPDGQRFLVVTQADETDLSARPQINIVLNWFSELRERVPVD